MFILVATLAGMLSAAADVQVPRELAQTAAAVLGSQPIWRLRAPRWGPIVAGESSRTWVDAEPATVASGVRSYATVSCWQSGSPLAWRCEPTPRRLYIVETTRQPAVTCQEEPDEVELVDVPVELGSEVVTFVRQSRAVPELAKPWAIVPHCEITRVARQPDGTIEVLAAAGLGAWLRVVVAQSPAGASTLRALSAETFVE